IRRAARVFRAGARAPVRVPSRRRGDRDHQPAGDGDATGVAAAPRRARPGRCAGTGRSSVGLVRRRRSRRMPDLPPRRARGRYAARRPRGHRRGRLDDARLSGRCARGTPGRVARAHDRGCGMNRTLQLDTVGLHVLHNALATIAAEMAPAITKTSYSTIFSEGLDFSTVLLDAQGNLIAEKNYTPSMMGAIPHTVRWALEEFGADFFQPGDVVVHNDPYRGNCHLPEHMMMKP